MTITEKVRQLIMETVGVGLPPEHLTNDYMLLGNLLDSMAVMKLILSIEDCFQFHFSDEELSAEAFETIESVSALVSSKVDPL